MKSLITEDHVEEAALQILQEDLGYEYIYGPDIAPDGKTSPKKSPNPKTKQNKTKNLKY